LNDGDHVREVARLYRESRPEYLEQMRSRSKARYYAKRESILEKVRNNPKTKEIQKTYHQKNRAKILVKKKEHREKNRDAISAYQVAYRSKTSEQRRQYAIDNREHIRKIQNEWAIKNPDKIKAKKHRRRSKESGNGGQFTAQEWNELVEKFNHQCVCCKQVKKLEADHVIPVSKGGTTNIENIQPLCRSCNARKNNKIIDYR
jgi:5-methylcytosine-specific restriction endonuclease McrA